METPIQDLSSGLALGCPNGPNATTSIAVGTGLSNSTNIDGVCFDTNYAATKSLLYSLNGYNDWFLPSQGDFNLMHQNLHKKGVGNFRNYSGPNWIVQNSNRYWTSSLLAQYGYAFDFGNGSTIPVNNQIVGRNELNRVRPARFVSGEVKYLWSTGDTTPNITVNPAQTTTYYLTATHNGMVCTDSTTIMVSGTPSNFAPYGRDSVVLCSDSARLDAGPGYVSYLWSHGANSKVTFVSTPGWYTITVVDSIGCSGVDSVFVYNSDLSASIIVDQNASCFGGSNGRAILTVTGGTAPYLINWSNGSASNDTLSNLSAGLYWVLVTDALGCAISDSVSIQEPQLALTAITSKTNVSCHGGNDGSVAVAASGGTGPYSYTWLTNPPRSGNALINVSAGIYPVMVVDANGCQYTTSLVVSEPTALVNSVTVQHVQCFGQPNGSAVVQTSGGTAGYQYAWNGGAFTLNNSMGGLDTGLNYVEILDANGCSDSIAFVINGPPSPIQHLATATNVSCYGLSNGSAQVLASGGSGSLQITWNTIPIAVGSSIIGRPAGTYKYTILDVVHGCMVVDSVVISQPIAPLSHTTITTDVLCYSDSSGSAQVTPLGGSSPYSINWTSSSIVGFNPASLWAGWHFFTLTDANGCLLSDSLEIKEPLVPLTLATGVTNVLCYGDSTGSAWVSASGGTGPYVVLWSANNATNDTLTGIPSGTYSVTVTDSVGCFATQIITVQQPQLPLTITTISQSALCFGTNSGTAAVIVQGGTGPYSIMWSDTLSSTTTSITQLYSGWYFVNVTDQNGCSILDSVFVGQPSSSLSIQSGTTSVGCFGSATGSAWVSANGGTAPYTYFWPHNGTTNDSITNLSAGTYLIQVQDANQCSETLSISITQTAPLTSITSQQHILCKGDSTGSITVSPQGGWSPYRIVWNTGDTNMVLNNLYAGMYSASITDSLGCSDSIFIQITEPQSALNSIGLSTDATCSGSIDGSIQVIASGGVGPYSYSLNSQTPVPQGIFTSLSAGTYICAITDANGCSITDTFQINEPNPISFVAAVDPVTCFGNSDGAIDLTISGGTNSYNVIWSTGATGPKLSGISGGWYQFSINDGNGCGLTDSIFVAEPDVLLLTLSVLHPECSNSFNGSITGIASGGSGNYSFTMNNNSSNGIEPNLGVGTYTVSVVDANGCSESTTIQLSAQRTPCVEIPNWFSPNGNGTNDSWEIPGFEYGNYTLYVVNVWGQKIYQTSSDNYLPWDGTFNGEPMPNGDYYYVISSTDETEPTFAGYVTILR
jgi:gliding motility-associated-like protein